MLSNSSLQYETVLLHKNQVNHLFRKFFFNINDFKCTKQYITHLMHDSEQEPVAYSTLPFKVQTTPLDYKLHTDCTVHLQHSTPTRHQETMGRQQKKNQQHCLLLIIHTYKMHQAFFTSPISDAKPKKAIQINHCNLGKKVRPQPPQILSINSIHQHSSM